MSASVPTPYTHSLDTVPDRAVSGRQTIAMRGPGRRRTHPVRRQFGPASGGAVGLFVDIGTEAFFSGLRVQPALADKER